MDIKPFTDLTPSHMELLLLADPSEKLVKEYTSRGCCFKAVEGNQLIGVIVLLPTRPGTIEIVNLAVAENMQKKGYGTRLVKFGVDYAKQHQYADIEIGTGNSGIGQLYLYQKCGFRITGIDRNFFIRHYDSKIMENGLPCIDMIRLSMHIEN